MLCLADCRLGAWCVGTLVTLMYGGPWGWWCGPWGMDAGSWIFGASCSEAWHQGCPDSVCVCCPTLPDVGAFCCADPPWRSFAVLPCEWDCGCPWTGWPLCLLVLCLVQRGWATVSQSYKSEHQMTKLSLCTLQTIPTVTDLHTKQS